MRSACSPATGPRGGLRRNIISQAALHHCSWQLLLVLLWRSVGFLLLYTPVLIHSKNIFTVNYYVCLLVYGQSHVCFTVWIKKWGWNWLYNKSRKCWGAPETTSHLSCIRLWAALTMLLSLSSRLPLVTVQLCSSSALSSKGVPPVAMSPTYSLLEFTTKCILVTKTT